MPEYLQKRRRRWYAVLDIPKQLHPTFGKGKFVKSLETDSLSVAERKVLLVIAGWKKEIELAKGNEIGTDDEILNNINIIRRDVQERKAKGEDDESIQMLHEEIGYGRSWNPDINAFESDDELFGSAVSVVYGSEIYLTEHIEEYQDTRDVTPKTRDMQTRDIKLFSDHFLYAHSVTREKVVHWVNVILGTENGLAPATRSRIISACRGYWEYLNFNKGLDIEPPFNKVLARKSKRMTKQQVSKLRTSFKVKDYHKILAACEHEPLKDLIKIVAHSGCRIEEICSLKLENISHDRFEIEDAKTRSGWRTVPIHSEIKQLITRLIDTTEDEYLFCNLPANKYGKRSDAIGKRFGRLKTKLGYGS